jgi:hypothetical protein
MKINLQNYESYFLSYIDKELALTEIREVEQFINENPALKDALTVLAQTKLTAEPIIYQEKALLYRHEAMEANLPVSFKKSLYRSEAKVVKGFFTRARIVSITAIAAMLLLLIGYRFYFNEQPIENNALSQNKKQENRNALQIASNSPMANARIAATSLIENNSFTKHINEATQVTGDKLFTSNNAPLNKETNFIQQEIITTNTENKESELAIGSMVAENIITNSIENHADVTIENANVNIPANLTNTNNLTEEQEAYNNINTEDHERGIYIANFEIDGDKLRGFSRRINAILKRNKNEKQK